MSEEHSPRWRQAVMFVPLLIAIPNVVRAWPVIVAGWPLWSMALVQIALVFGSVAAIVGVSVALMAWGGSRSRAHG